MVKKTPINCMKCGHLVGYQEDFMYIVIPADGIKCPCCGELVIASNQPIY